MDKITITSDEWTEVIPAGSVTDMIIQSVQGFIAATGDEPTEEFGISLVPFEKWIVPAGVQVWGKANGAIEATVITGVFGT